MYKALIFDVDGTIVPVSSDGSEITEDVRKLLREVQTTGAQITCATGREWELVKPVIEALGLRSLCIVEGGTRIVDSTNEETVWEKIMDLEAVENVKKTFDDHYETGLLMHSEDIARIPTKVVANIPDSIRFLYLLRVPEEVAERIQNEINTAEFDAVAHLTPSWEGEGFVDVHVTHTEGTKEYAIKTWQEMVGVAQEETVGMGDSGNDLPLFNASGLKVAVGNATSGLRELADYTAPDVREGSLEHVLKKFFSE